MTNKLIGQKFSDPGNQPIKRRLSMKSDGHLSLNKLGVLYNSVYFKVLVPGRFYQGRWKMTAPQKMSMFYVQNSKVLASAGNRTRAARVAGEHSTTEPPMLHDVFNFATEKIRKVGNSEQNYFLHSDRSCTALHSHY